MSTAAIDPLASMRLQQQVKQKQTLGQDDFLALMVAQLKNQDPFKPMDNGEFLGQMAQFSTVSGIQKLQDSFSTLATSLTSNQALQAASLVGRGAMVNASTLALEDGSEAYGAIEVPAGAADVTLEVRDASGATVRRVNLGSQPAGIDSFQWDGTDESGNRVAAGAYTIQATATIGGKTQSLNTLVAERIDSVTLDGANGLVLNLAHLGPTAFTSIRQFL